MEFFVYEPFLEDIILVFLKCMECERMKNKVSYKKMSFEVKRMHIIYAFIFGKCDPPHIMWEREVQLNNRW